MEKEIYRDGGKGGIKLNAWAMNLQCHHDHNPGPDPAPRL